MRGPDLKLLVRSLRTRSYEKLSIQKYMDAVVPRQEGEVVGFSSQKEFDFGKKPYRKVQSDKDDL